MSRRKLVIAALAATLPMVPLAGAQTVPWRVVAGESGNVATPDLPAGVARSFNDYRLGDAGAGLVGLRVNSPAASAGFWASAQGVLKRYVQTGVTGPLGPGRSDGESGDVFLSYSTSGGGGAAAADGERAFLARAGDPALPDTAASYGLWRWDTTHNLEMARSLTDGALGPGLGAGWVFPNTSAFTGDRMLDGGRALLVATVTTPTGASRDLVALHVPGQGNRPCALEDSTDPALSPGLTAGDSFVGNWNGSLTYFSVTAGGRIYATLSASGSRMGIWELCDGAPRTIAVDDEPGARGPDLGIATAYFTSFYGPPVPGDEGTFFFVAAGHEISGGAAFGGLFRNDGASNLPVALDGDTGFYSPHWEDATFSSITESTLSAAGEYASFEADLHTSDGGNPGGLFRVRAGQSPEPVAILGVIGAYGPEPNRTWSNFRASAVLSNGDIVLEAYTNPGSEYALWLLQSGRAPRRILRAGDTAAVPTASGTVPAAVTSFSLPEGNGSGAQYSRGVDSWIGADGTILISANLNGYGSALLTAQPSNPVNLVFANGFDG